jgi:hypothetical protein
MPNNCENNLVLKGKREVLLPLYDLLFDRARTYKEYHQLIDAFLAALYPEPEEVKKFRSEDRYLWRANNWGCTRGVDEKPRVSYSETGPDGELPLPILEVDFETASSPPIGAVKQFCLANKVSAVLMYYEGGEGFAGQATITWDEESQEFKVEESDYDLNEELDQISDDLDVAFAILDRHTEDEEDE